MSDQYVFGSGQLYQTPVGGGAPVRFGTLQDVNIDFDGDMKELFGQYGFPLAVARGKQKVTIKAGNGAFNIPLYNNLYFGDTAPATGGYAQALNESGMVPATSTYTVTVANAAKFYMDLGVTLAATGAALTQVASAPATGQYSVAAGVYTFNLAQASAAVVINYIYTTTTGTTLTLANQLIGTQPKFRLLLSETFGGNWLIVQLNSCVCGKLTMPLKLDDFMMNDLEMSAQVDATGTLGWISTSV